MKTFDYVVKDELGLHARPAGLLVKCAAAFSSNIKIAKDGKEADAKRLFGVMGLGVKKDDTITFTIEGGDELKAAEAVEEFCKANF